MNGRTVRPCAFAGPARRAHLAVVVGSLSVLLGVGSPGEARAQVGAPGFTLAFEGPASVAGPPGSAALAAFKCRLSQEGLDPSIQASGWTFGVETAGECEISFATTLGSVGADIADGGLRSGGFELTELTTGPGNEGAVSVVVLRNGMPITLPPEESHHLLGIEVSSLALVAGGCLPCTVRYRSGLVSSSGTAVDVGITASGMVVAPNTLESTVELCAVECFPDEAVPGFSLWQVGAVATGTARLVDEIVEVCSSSRGYGGASDSLILLARDAAGDFTLEAEVISVEGEAGVEARAFSGTGADPYGAVLRISARAVVPPGVAEEADIVTGFRAHSGDELQPSPALLRVLLPVRLGVRQEGSGMMAYYVSGADRIDLASVIADGTGLEGPLHRVGIAHGSDPGAPNPPAGGHPRTGSARFRYPDFQRPPDPELPQLARSFRGSQGVPGRSTTIVLGGYGLSTIQEVTVAGLPAEIVAVRENEIELLVPPTGLPLRGDIVVHTPEGVVVLPNSFFSYGEEFIRCDCNGDGEPDISDAVASLQRLFLGAAPCRCGEAQDCNDDDEKDISDPIFLLTFLFLGGGRSPPPPFPAPGADALTGLCLPDLPVVAGASVESARTGDVFTITGEGFSPIPEQNIVLANDAVLRVLEATESSLTVEAEMVVTGGDTPVFVLVDYNAPGPACPPRGCGDHLRIGPVGMGSSTAVNLVSPAEPEFQVFATSRNENGRMIIEFDPDFFDPTRPLALHASLISSVVPDVSPGARVTRFEHTFLRGAETTFEEALGEIADRLDRELSGGGPMAEVLVLADPEHAQIVIEPQHPAVGGPGVPCVFTALYYQYLDMVSGRCGPQKIRPITFMANTEREFAWCRFQELVEVCDGLPSFEWFIPLEFVVSKTGSLAALPHPNDVSPKRKAIMYSSAAYCHVRDRGLWNKCVLEDLKRNNAHDIPDFPSNASIVKTEWRTDDPGAPKDDRLGADVDKSRFYSYVYSGDGRRWYLTALHHITQDLPYWFWYDIYVPLPTIPRDASSDAFPLHAGTGGCGGTNLDAPAPIASSGWQSYFLCTDVHTQQPYQSTGFARVGPDFTRPIPQGNSAWCGNFEFSIECPDVFDGGGGQQTCVQCHLRAVAPTCKPLGLDLLYSLAHPISVPDPCYPPCPIIPPPPVNIPVNFKTQVQPIFSSRCSCHTGGGSPAGLSLAPGSSHANIVNKPSTQAAAQVLVKPGSTGLSYLWHKLQNTQVQPPMYGAGLCMPYNSCGFSLTGEGALIKKWIEEGATP